MEFTTKNSRETQNLGKKIGAGLKGGEVLALIGDLGAGKTTFVQGLAQGLGVTDRITSPTFILMRTYRGKDLDLYHLDMYRLDDNFEDEARNLGLKDVWKEKKNVVVIEWAEKIRDLLPEKTIFIEFSNLGAEERKISVKYD